MTQPATIVCDIGTGLIKLGFAGDLTPAIVVPSVVGIVKQKVSATPPLVVFGKDALAINENIEIDFYYPIDAYDGFYDWEAMVSLLQYSFAMLQIKDFSGHKIFFTRPRGMSRKDLATLYELALILFGFQGVGARTSDSLVLSSHGLESGIVIDLGESFFKVVPVHHGQALYNEGSTMEISGRCISRYYMKMLHDTGHPEFESRSITADPSSKAAQRKGNCHHLTDTFWTLLAERGIEPSEYILRPELSGSREDGLADTVVKTVQTMEFRYSVNLCDSIVLSGGMSLLPGVCEGLQSELNSRIATGLGNGMAQNLAFKVHAAESRGCLPFEGASLFADLVCEEPPFWLTKDEFLATKTLPQMTY